MRRTLAAPGLAAVLGMALLLTACGKTNAHNNTAGETVSTALFDFSITDASLVVALQKNKKQIENRTEK